MALTGLQINKLLPRTNCKECGSNTCLAFAMKLAQKKASLEQCPYASDEARQVLGAAAEPPMKTVRIGPQDSQAGGALAIGGETVLYRHEKTFVHQTLLAVNVNEQDPPEAVAARVNGVRDYVLERVGEELRVELLAVTQHGGDAAAFAAFVANVAASGKRPLVLRGRDAASLQQAAQAAAPVGGVLCAPTPEIARELAQTAVETGLALAVGAPDLRSMAAATAELAKVGCENLLLFLQPLSLAERFLANTVARRAALKDGDKALGRPHLSFVDPGVDLAEATVQAATEICKYGGVCVLPGFDPAQLAPLLTLRQNIYTDPQKPIQVEPRVYAIGEPGPESPVFVTTNFSLTYFLVAGEIDGAGLSAWLAVPDCEGMSVLTAWAAGKLTAAKIAACIKEDPQMQAMTRKRVILPGFVAVLKGELEDGLPGWEVLVGPQESADLEAYVAGLR
jgi:acetyl-CoA decarbonylase/synthase, CODH/ACS complex subunit gamma